MEEKEGVTVILLERDKSGSREGVEGWVRVSLAVWRKEYVSCFLSSEQYTDLPKKRQIIGHLRMGQNQKILGNSRISHTNLKIKETALNKIAQKQGNIKHLETTTTVASWVG